jgi:hypothetical protein
MKLPRSSFRILRIILLGYLHQGGSSRKGVGLDAVAKSTGLNRTLVSANNAALAELGIIAREKGGSYSLTAEGSQVARALEFEEPELTKQSLVPLLAGNDTISATLNVLRVRGPMLVDAFANQLLISAGEPKTASAQTGARAVIEMLSAAGLLDLDGDRVIAPAQRPETATQTETEVVFEPETATPVRESQGSGHAFQIGVQVVVASADLLNEETLERLLAALRRIASTAQGENEN